MNSPKLSQDLYPPPAVQTCIESKGECHAGSVGVSNEVVGVSVCYVWSVRRTRVYHPAGGNGL